MIPRFAHRKPPMPRWPGMGHCRWCAAPVLHRPGTKRAGEVNPRSCWHPSCVSAYLVASGSGGQRGALWRRDRGHCALCGQHDPEWQADHIVPLWTVPLDLPQGQRGCFWSRLNLWTLCRDCHGAKTAREAGMRATRRKAA